jgi:hypothetical protein
MFTDKQPISYCKLRSGKVEVYQGKDKEPARFDFMSGIVTDIRSKTNEWKGEEIKSWEIVLQDGEELHILSLGYSSSLTRGFFNILASADVSRPVRIGCYVKITDKGEWTCPSISQDGELLRWKDENPPKTEAIIVKNKKIIDDEEAVKWMLALIDEIKVGLHPVQKVEAKEVAEIMGGEVVDEEMPSDLPF